jgi:undecaprenyl-diphosphatase
VSLLQSIILGIVQGLTEFIPVSSSGHLVLVPWLLKWSDPGLAFDAVLHLGTLLAILVYFWRDWVNVIVGFCRSLRQRSLADPHARLAWAVIIATIPAGLLGLAFNDLVASLFGSALAVALLLLVTAALLVVGEKWGRSTQAAKGIGMFSALGIGLAQAVAIVPGVSRAGATISAGRLLGLRREEAAHFSFLLAAPITGAAGALSLFKIVKAGALQDSGVALAVGFLVAAVSGYLVIRFLLNYLRKRSIYPFAAYCAVFGLVCLAVALLGLR